MRVKKRLGLPTKAIPRQVNNAYSRGRKREEFKGPIRKYLDFLWYKGRNTQAATDIIVYGNAIFLFAGRILVTSWPLPARFRRTKVDGYMALEPEEEPGT